MNEQEPTREVHFHYLKSPAFRSIHADGASGGLTPRGGFHMALFAERAPIPQETIHELDSEGGIKQERARIAKEGIIRELQVDVFMSMDTAETLARWLMAHVDAFKQTMAKMEQDTRE